MVDFFRPRRKAHVAVGGVPIAEFLPVGIQNRAPRDAAFTEGAIGLHRVVAVCKTTSIDSHGNEMSFENVRMSIKELRQDLTPSTVRSRFFDQDPFIFPASTI